MKEFYIYCSFLARFIASIIDSIILKLVYFVLAKISKFALGISIIDWESLPIRHVEAEYDNHLIIFIEYIIVLSYYSMLTSSSMEGTIGKRLLGIKVLTKNNSRLSFRKALTREIIKVLSCYIVVVILMILYGIFFNEANNIGLLICFLLSSVILAIPIIFTEEGKSIHDMICSTRVLKVLAYQHDRCEKVL